MSRSALYSGTVRHRRYAEQRREFVHPVSLLYLDLDELPRLYGGALTRRGPGLVRFRRRDFHGPSEVDLAVAVRDTVARVTGERPEGPVRLLGQLRTLGIGFNPVAFYYCFAADGQTVQAVLAEVTNTPWGERHAYVIEGTGGEFAKVLHVSPFLPMDHRYRVRLGVPGDTLPAHLENWSADGLQFDATLNLRRRRLAGSPAALVAAQRLGPLRTLALIYGHGLTLWRRGVTHYPKPREAS